MFEKASKQALPGGRLNAFWMDPSELTIVGIDTDDDKDSATHDPRISLPLDDNFVLNIMTLGVRVPIIVRKVGDVVEVVDGRQRVRGAREANKRFTARGEPTIRVPVLTPAKEEEDVIAGLGVALNEARTDDGFVTKAKKAMRLRDVFGKSEKEIAVLFGASLKAAQTLLAFGKLSAKVQKAVDKGIVAPSTACHLAEFEHAEQDEKFQALIDEAGGGTVKSSSVRRKVQAERKSAAPDDKKDDVQGVNVGRKVLAAIVEADREDKTLDPGFIKGIQFAMGNLDASQVGGLLKVLRRINKDREDNGKGVLYAVASEAAEA